MAKEGDGGRGGGLLMFCAPLRCLMAVDRASSRGWSFVPTGIDPLPMGNRPFVLCRKWCERLYFSVYVTAAPPVVQW